MKDLERDETVVLDASGQEHRSARAVTELALDLVRPFEGPIEMIAEARHC